jgi:hypothetical protein
MNLVCFGEEIEKNLRKECGKFRFEGKRRECGEKAKESREVKLNCLLHF